MDLQVIWFVLIAVLYTGFFFLEGFDFGVGMLLPFLGRRDIDRRVIINTIAPHWDGNEVWLLTAGGATFAAFPHWYATLFSGFYPALFLLLVALILRGVAFEFRSKHTHPSWRKAWDWCIFIGGLLPAFLLGVAFSNLAMGVPIDAEMTYVGGFLNLLNPYALLGGLAMVAMMATYGAAFLGMKTEKDIMERAQAAAHRLWWAAFFLGFAFLIVTFLFTDISSKGVLAITPVMAAVALLVAGNLTARKNSKWSFILIGLAILLTVATFFVILFPRVMISSIDPEYSLTIYNSSSSPYTLTIMSIVAAFFVPFVLAYQAWTYHVFRKRVTTRRGDLVY